MNIVPSTDFPWDEDPDVVIQSQCAIAVYLNSAGRIVIRQERAWSDDEDVFILVQPQHAHLLAGALQRAARDPELKALPAPVPPPRRKAGDDKASEPSLFPAAAE